MRKGDWSDLGNGHRYKRFTYGRQVVGLLHEFPDGCMGAIYFRGCGLNGQSEWDVISDDPLTLEPSILTTGPDGHTHHRYIRNGRWEDA